MAREQSGMWWTVRTRAAPAMPRTLLNGGRDDYRQASRAPVRRATRRACGPRTFAALHAYQAVTAAQLWPRFYTFFTFASVHLDMPLMCPGLHFRC